MITITISFPEGQLKRMQAALAAHQRKPLAQVTEDDIKALMTDHLREVVFNFERLEEARSFIPVPLSLT